MGGEGSPLPCTRIIMLSHTQARRCVWPSPGSGDTHIPRPPSVHKNRSVIDGPRRACLDCTEQIGRYLCGCAKIEIALCDGRPVSLQSRLAEYVAGTDHTAQQRRAEGTHSHPVQEMSTLPDQPVGIRNTRELRVSRTGIITGRYGVRDRRMSGNSRYMLTPAILTEEY